MTTLTAIAPTLSDRALAASSSGDTAGMLFTGVFIAGLAVVGIALVVLFVAALVSILRSPMELLPTLAWIGIVLVLQLVGPLLWFAVGRRMAGQNPPAGREPVLER